MTTSNPLESNEQPHAVPPPLPPVGSEGGGQEVALNVDTSPTRSGQAEQGEESAQVPQQKGIFGWVRNFGRKFRRTLWATPSEKQAMSPEQRGKRLSRRKFLGKSTAAAGSLAAAYYLGTRGNGSTSREAPETTAKKPSGGFAFRESELGHESTQEEIRQGMPEIYKGNETIWDGFDQGQRDRLREGNQQLVSDGVVDKQGRVIETKKPEKGGKKPNEVQTALSSLNSLWNGAPIPAIEAMGWMINNLLRGKNYKKLMQVTTGIKEETVDGELHPAIAEGTDYGTIDMGSQALAQLRKLRHDIATTKGQVTLIMHNTDNTVSLWQRGAQAAWLAGEIVAETGLTLTGILSSSATYHNAMGIGIAILLSQLRGKTSEPKNEAMLKKLLADLDVYLGTAKDAIDELVKAGEGAKAQKARDQAKEDADEAHRRKLEEIEAQARAAQARRTTANPSPPAANPAPPPPTPQPPSNPNPAGGQTPTP